MAAPRKPFDPPSPEQTAFLELAINEYGRPTYNYALRLTHNEADARDLTQEAFIRVYRAWRSFQPGTSFLSWIYRIVTNLYRDELRRRKGRYQEEIPEDNAPQRFGQTRPMATEPIEELVERQQVLILADVEEYSYQEIADIVGCSIGTVRSRLHRARHQLRRQIESQTTSSS